MAPRKLSDADKRDVIELYKQPGETTSTIADRYGVSSSTVSRILKTLIPEDDYRSLVAQKRAGAAAERSSDTKQESASKDSQPESTSKRRRSRRRSSSAKAEPSNESKPDSAAAPDAESADESRQTSSGKPVPRLRKKSSDSSGQLDLLEEQGESESQTASPQTVSKEKPRKKIDKKPAAAEESELDNFDDLDDDLDDEDFDSDDDLDDEDDLGDDLDEDDLDDDGIPHFLAAEIMPLTDAVFPRTCYLVVDRLSELITRPLKEFAELGNIPADQASAQTLPVFDNHRVARRFSRRNQRVIKVPDGQLITKASAYLQAKGITHLMIDGNLYALLGDD